MIPDGGGVCVTFDPISEAMTGTFSSTSSASYQLKLSSTGQVNRYAPVISIKYVNETWTVF